MALYEPIYDLIIRKWLGNLTSEEEKYLTDWLSDSRENQQEADEMVAMFVRSRRLYSLTEPDLEQLYQEFVQKQRILKRRKRTLWMRHAALFILPLSVAIGVYWGMNKVSTSDISVEGSHQVLPVSQKVRLKLSSGKLIELTADQEKVIQEKSGIQVSNNGQGLNYQLKSVETDTNNQIQYNILTVPRGAEYALTLSDGTRIWLNAESELKYPVRFTRNFREVFLKGEAYFEVAHNASSPFWVKVRDLSVKVLGTAFNVMAYPDEQRIETTLENGQVNVYSGDKEVQLQPGMQAVFHCDSKDLKIREVNTLLYTSWKDSRMIFEELRLEELLDRLGRWYDVQIFYQNNELKDIRLTGNISKHEQIAVVLDLIHSMGKVEFQMNGRTVIVRKIQK